MHLRIPMAIAAVAVAVRLVPAVLSYGTSDVMTWELLGRMLLKGENFYATQLHNWPPLWIYFTAVAVMVHDATNLPFSTLVKVPPVLADALIAALLCHLALRRTNKIAPAIAAGAAYAMNPVSVLITGYHGQFDSMMLAPTFVAWYLWRPVDPGTEPVVLPALSSAVGNYFSDSRQAEPVARHATGAHAHASSPLADSPTASLPRLPARQPHATDPAEDASLPRPEVPPETTTALNPMPSPATVRPRLTDSPSTPVAPHEASRTSSSAPSPPASAPTGRRLVVSALALGIGIWFKPVPLLLLPVLLPRIQSWRDRLLFTALALAPTTLGTAPFLVFWPEDVAANFIGYSSWFGQWGYPVLWMVVEYVRNGTIPWWLPDPNQVSRPLRVMSEAGKYVLIAALGATWWLTYRRGKSVLAGILSTFSVFYFATSGFGVQYLLWIVPFAIAARDRWLWPFTVAATGLLLVAYTLGVAYMPLPVTPDNAPNAREFIVKLASLPTWLVCGAWAWSVLRRRN